MDQAPTDTNASPPAAKPPTSPAQVWIALAVCVAAFVGAASWAMLLDIPSIRSTAWVNFIMVGADVAIGIWLALRWRRRIVTVLAGVNVTVLVLFTAAFFFMMTVPTTGHELATGQPAADFTLPNHDGSSVSLADFHAKGPVLLVFYRGFW